MAKEGYFAHDSPSGVTPWEWFDEVEYTYETAGENLAIDFSDSDAVVDAWMDSRLHRENILEEDFTEIGIATARGEYEGRETVFVVQMFGTPDERELAERSGEGGGTETAQAGETDNTESAAADTNTTTTTTTTTTAQTTSTEDLVAQLQNEVNEIQQEVVENQGQTVEGTQQQQSIDTPSTTPDKQQTKETSSRADRLAQKSETNSDNTQTSQPDDTQATTTRQAATSSVSTQTNQTTTTTTTTQANFKRDTSSTPTPAGQVQGLTGVSLLPADQASGFAHLLSQPQLVYQLTFVSIAGLVLLTLLVSIIVEAKHHHWKLAGYSMLALVVLIGVFYAGSQLLFTEPVIAGSQIIFASNF
jgi:hypothetical protein